MLIDSELDEHRYEMKFSLRMPQLHFASDPLPFSITNGVYSAFILPDIVADEGYEIKEAVIVSDDRELAKYIAYNEIDNTISYTPPKNCNAEFKFILEPKMISIKLTDNYGDEYIHDL